MLLYVAPLINEVLGTPIAGALLTSSYIWWRPIIFAGVFVALGGVLFTIARTIIVAEKHTQRV